VQFDIIDIFRKMSGFQWVVVGTLLAMAVASSAVVLERLWTFWRSRRSSRELAPVAARLIAAGEHHRLVHEADGRKASHLARLLAAGAATFLQASRRPRGAVSPAELARREMARQRETFDAELRRGMGVLASTGSVAPFVGLLGTVVGIIAAFEGIAKEGSGGLGAVSAGIAEALVVTAFGLFVAIPTVLLFNFLSTRVERLMLDLDQAAGQLADHLEAGVPAPEPTDAHDGAAELPDASRANGGTRAAA
jgi:biopolymer transport protein ExbB